MLTAPAASASSVVTAPFSVNVEQITTGVGRSAMILRRNVRPSMRGISTSRTITSGHCSRIRSMAKIGSETAAITVIAGSVDSCSETTCRTTAESSTTSTWICFMPPTSRPSRPS